MEFVTVPALIAITTVTTAVAGIVRLLELSSSKSARCARSARIHVGPARSVGKDTRFIELRPVPILWRGAISAETVKMDRRRSCRAARDLGVASACMMPERDDTAGGQERTTHPN